MTGLFDRRQLLRGAGIGGVALSASMPAGAQTSAPGLVRDLPEVSGDDIRLKIAHQMLTIDGRHGHVIGINGTVPGPLIRLREGQNVRLHVENALDEDSSIHWHGLILPFHMDGVPGVSFPGHQAAHNLYVRVRHPSGGHILVSRPFGLAGTDGALWPDRDRTRGRRPDRVRP